MISFALPSDVAMSAAQPKALSPNSATAALTEDFTLAIRHKFSVGVQGEPGHQAETAYSEADPGQHGLQGDFANFGRVTQAQHDTANGPHAGKTVGMLYQSFNLTHGMLYVWNDKSWTFDIDQTHADVNGLNFDQVMTKTVEFTITDSRNGAVKQELTITITGANDKPTGLSVTAADDEVTEASGPNNEIPGDSRANGSLDFTDGDREHDAAVLWANRDFNIQLRHKTHDGASSAPAWSTTNHPPSTGDGNADGNQDDAVTVGTSSAVTEQESAAAGSIHNGIAANTLYRSWDVVHGTIYIYDDKTWRFELNDDNAEVEALGPNDTIIKTFGLTVVDSHNGESSEVEFTITTSTCI